MEALLEFIQTHAWLETSLCLIGLVALSFIVNFLMRIVLLRTTDSLLALIKIDSLHYLHHSIHRLANILPALIFSLGIPLVPHLPADIATIGKNSANAVIIFLLALAIAALLNFLNDLYQHQPQAQLKPIKGLVQIAKIALFSVTAILMLATILDRSPLILFSGLGAVMAILLLVFQDTLLSFVAGIQLSSTDMVRVGDWIESPGQGADGEVIEVSLHTIRVQNWDKTITNVPIRKLVNDAFKNWRGMQESGGRRIKRSLYIDQASIDFLTSQDEQRLHKLVLLEDYLAQKQEELSLYNSQLGQKAAIEANRRRLTNIGTFRAYITAYLKAHPGIHQGMTIMVRQTSPGASGLPLELYCFTNTTAWLDYESIQADIFDHLYSIAPDFGLRIFQSPSGHDMQLLKL